MKIIEILEDTAPTTATPTTPAKKYQNIDTLKKDPEVLVKYGYTITTTGTDLYTISWA